MSTRVKYDKLPEGSHTYVFEDDKGAELDPVDGMYPAKSVKEIQRNDVVEVEDLNDPKSRMARGVRQHLDGIGRPGQSGSQAPLCTLLEEKPKKSPASKTAA